MTPDQPSPLPWQPADLALYHSLSRDSQYDPAGPQLLLQAETGSSNPVGLPLLPALSSFHLWDDDETAERPLWSVGQGCWAQLELNQVRLTILPGPARTEPYSPKWTLPQETINQVRQLIANPKGDQPQVLGFRNQDQPQAQRYALLPDCPGRIIRIFANRLDCGPREIPNGRALDDPANRPRPATIQLMLTANRRYLQQLQQELGKAQKLIDLNTSQPDRQTGIRCYPGNTPLAAWQQLIAATQAEIQYWELRGQNNPDREQLARMIQERFLPDQEKTANAAAYRCLPSNPNMERNLTALRRNRLEQQRRRWWEQELSRLAEAETPAANPQPVTPQPSDPLGPLRDLLRSELSQHLGLFELLASWGNPKSTLERTLAEWQQIFQERNITARPEQSGPDFLEPGQGVQLVDAGSQAPLGQLRCSRSHRREHLYWWYQGPQCSRPEKGSTELTRTLQIALQRIKEIRRYRDAGQKTCQD